MVANPAQLGIGVALIATVLYYRKASAAASVVGGVVGKLVFAAAVVGVLLLSGVITGIDVAQASEYTRTMVSFAWEAVETFLSEYRGG
jgi:uncharacterized membrane protein YraQ (UPF0718 family)